MAAGDEIPRRSEAEPFKKALEERELVVDMAITSIPISLSGDDDGGGE